MRRRRLRRVYPAADVVTCDAIDEDCDGTEDEDHPETPTTCGEGACAASGPLVCAAGTEIATCVPREAAASDATCDGVDDDCDGLADEDYAPTSTTCGVGACVASGETRCIGGTETDSCVPATPAASDATCDAIDDDCDGTADEDFVSSPTTCGVGSCAATGATSCVAGEVRDSCSPGTPAEADASCDAIDDDCDGAADEDYASMATTCGGVARQAPRSRSQRYDAFRAH